MLRHYIGEQIVHDLWNFQQSVALRIAETTQQEHLIWRLAAASPQGKLQLWLQ
jgi:hypothetical protein